MKKENSTYQKKRRANNKFKDNIFSLPGLQRYAIRVFEKKEDNKDFLDFCNDLQLTKKDMLFSHVLKYGKEKELNHVSRKTGKIVAKKELFPFWLFETCLQRYREANPVTISEQINKVEITENKKKTNIAANKAV